MSQAVRFVLSIAVIVLLSSQRAAAQPMLELNDGDRVVILGGTFVEREGNYGYLETALATTWPDRAITFRNLGWSADTVWAESRGLFDPPAEGYRRMVSLIRELKPSVLVLAYGANESLAGESGLAAFVRQYEQLCEDVKSTNAKLVFLSPPPFEKARPPVPDISQRNQALAQFVNAIERLAERRSAVFVNLFRRVTEFRSTDAGRELAPFTRDGVTPTRFGYFHLAQMIAAELRLTRPQSAIFEWGQLRPNDNQWESLKNPEQAAPIELLRRKIVEKNSLFFHRWRPQNITYLTGFRKHEQGNNAIEIAQFDPLVTKLEADITLRLKTMRQSP